MKNMAINVGLLGLGTVGSGVYQIIENHQEQLRRQVGCEVKVVKVLVRDLQKSRHVEIPFEILTTDIGAILNDPTIDVVIEVMGGIELSYGYLTQALQNKKHVVTANKDVIAAYGSALKALAYANNCDLFYEASVAGGIPIIRSLVDGLASDKITKLMGIVNGTTNYILTKMSEEGMSYEQALGQAQALGFAEPDPTSDVEGLDAARKMVILAQLGFSMNVELKDVYTKGISSVTAEDIEYTKQLGYTLKLIGSASKEMGAVEISVQPTLLPNKHPLAAVQNEFNAVCVYGEAVGETMFYGPGAGGLPTATAVVSDLIAVIKNMLLGVNGKNVVVGQHEKLLKMHQAIFSKFFIRIQVKDEVGVFLKIAHIFFEHQLSFEKILQKPFEESKEAEIIVITHRVTLQNFTDALQALKALDEVIQIKSCYRVEEIKS